jgi:hypothetical protein
MARGRPKAELTLTEAEQAQLSSIAASRSMPAALVARARIVLPPRPVRPTALLPIITRSRRQP